MKIAVFAIVALLTGCATASDVIPLSDGKYVVTAGSHSLGSNGLGGTRAKAVKEATSFCEELQKRMAVEKFDDQQGINTYSTSLTFSCAPL